MSSKGKFVVVVALLWCVGEVVYASHRTDELQLLTLPLALLFLAAFVVGIVCVFKEWRQRSWRALIPLAACVASICVSDFLSQKIRHQIFTRTFPSYEAVVHKMETGQIPVPDKLTLMPQAVAEAKSAYAVLAGRDTNGVLTVEILTEGGFPVHHSGYLYVSSGVIPQGSFMDERWPFRYQVTNKWFYVSD